MGPDCRYFLGVDFAHQHELAFYVDQLAGEDLQWQVPGKWHLTLCFLGNHIPEQCSKLSVLPLSEQLVRVQAVALFSHRKQTILTLDCRTPQLMRWRKAVLDAFSLADDEWHPHITLGRGKPAVLKKLALPPVDITLKAQCVYLFASSAQTKHQYQKIYTYALEK